MTSYLLLATDTSGEDASFEGHGATFEDAYARAEEALLGTAVRLDPLPTTCPVRLALREVRQAMRGVEGAGWLWQAEDELVKSESPPSVEWMRQRERYARDLAEHAGALAKAAMALATAAAAGLPEIERWRASVRVEAEV